MDDSLPSDLKVWPARTLHVVGDPSVQIHGRASLSGPHLPGQFADRLYQAEALQALRDAAWGVIQEHKRLGMPLTQWRDGKVVEISPEEAEAEYLAAKTRNDGGETAHAKT